MMMKKGVVYATVVLCVGAGIASAACRSPSYDAAIQKPYKLPFGGHIAYAFSFSGFAEFYLDDPGNITVGNGSLFFISGADFGPDGNLYCIDTNGGIYEMDMYTGVFCLIAMTIPCDCLVYDTTTNIWYVASSNTLYSIDITTGATTYVGSFGISNYMISLMVDTNGNMYGYDALSDGNSTLYSIDKTTGMATAIGDMGYDFIGGDGKFDRDDDILYIAGYFDGIPSALLICDTQTGNCTIVGDFEYGLALDGLAIPYGDNQYPYASFTWAPSNPLPGDTIVFNASASYDPDGHITLYEWDWNGDQVYDESHTTPITTHTWNDPGTHIVILKVTDDSGLTGKKSKTVTIENHPPEPPIIGGPTNGTVNHEYTFSIGPITDPDGDAMYCKWSWGDGTSTDWLGPYASGQMISASHTWIHAGVYEIRAKLKDTYGAESNWSDPHIITIFDNKPPGTPDITGSAKGKPGVTYLYAFNSTDPENDDIFYYVDWGDGTNTGWLGPYVSGQQKSASHSWSKGGTFTVKVKAKDSWGNESDWGTLPVHIPMDTAIPSLLQQLFVRFPHAFPLLRYLLGY